MCACASEESSCGKTLELYQSAGRLGSIHQDKGPDIHWKDADDEGMQMKVPCGLDSSIWNDNNPVTHRSKNYWDPILPSFCDQLDEPGLLNLPFKPALSACQCQGFFFSLPFSVCVSSKGRHGKKDCVQETDK